MIDWLLARACVVIVVAVVVLGAIWFAWYIVAPVIDGCSPFTPPAQIDTCGKEHDR